MRLKFKRLSLLLIVCLLALPAWAAREFDQADDYLTIADHDDLELRAPFSIVAWIYPDDAGQNANGRIIDKGGGSGAGGWSFNIRSSGGLEVLKLYVNGGSGGNDLESDDFGYVEGEWQHVAVTYTPGGVAQFYRNGATHGSDSGGSDPQEDTNDCIIGDRNTFGREWDGRLAYIQLFSVLLTGDEVKSLSLNPYSVTRGLIAHWPLFGNDSTEPNVFSPPTAGQSHHATNTDSVHAIDNPPIGPRMAAYSSFGAAAAPPAVRRRQNVVLGSLPLLLLVVAVGGGVGVFVRIGRRRKSCG